jgi:hypothetical protein
MIRASSNLLGSGRAVALRVDRYGYGNGCGGGSGVTFAIWTLTSKKPVAGVGQEDAGDLRIANIRVDPNYNYLRIFHCFGKLTS